jgi:Carboxypeptidase regulatory-like domain/TonB-dependent Receptor Plug Domain
MTLAMFARRTARTAWLLGSTLTLLAAPLRAQTSTATIRGYVTASDGTPAVGATLTARSTTTGLTRTSVANPRGFYVLAGLPPGEYTITARRIGLQPQTRTQTVGIGQAVQLDIKLDNTSTTLSSVNVVATRGSDTRTSEVATNVTSDQLRSLPTVDRNFLGFAALAPGVRINGDRNEGTTKNFTANGAPAAQVNVFIDGASQKSDVLPSGVGGQEASRGNPFPLAAVGEFRVLTSNFKAEYQKATSAIITATTQSGSNRLRGSVFSYVQTENMIALDSFQRARRAAAPGTFRVGNFDRQLFGGSVGGAVIKDKLFFFGAVEGNRQNRVNVVRFPNTTGLALLPDSTRQRFIRSEGEGLSPFRSWLPFAKLNFTPGERTNYELSYSGRFETDIRSFGNTEPVEFAENVRNETHNVNAKQTWSANGKLNEALLNVSYLDWNPSPQNPDLLPLDFQGIGRLGGRDGGGQTFKQTRVSLRDDFTTSNLQFGGDHVIKVGANVDRLNYEVTKAFFRTPVYRFNAADSYAFPREVSVATGTATLPLDNWQFGGYIQDDWSPTKTLTFNLGVRYDYETQMFDRSFVTPTDVRSAMDSVLRNRGFDPDNYFNDGKGRKPFAGAIQPRIGFAWSVGPQSATTIFGGAGIFYDRYNYNLSLDERDRLLRQTRNLQFSADGAPRNGQPTIRWRSSLLNPDSLRSLASSGAAGRPEVFLVENDTKLPRAEHLSLGVRHLWRETEFSVTYAQINSSNGFAYIFGTRNATGQCCSSVAPFQNLLLSTDDSKIWYSNVAFRVDHPYINRGNSRWNWGGGLTWTVQEAEQQGVFGGDFFALDFPRIQDYPRVPTPQSVRNTFVGNFIVDVPYLWGIQASTVISLNSGDRFTIDDQSRGGSVNDRRLQRNEGKPPTKSFFPIPGSLWGFRNVDFRLAKFFRARDTRLGLTAELFNAFNFTNLGGFDGFIATLPAVNNNFGRANGVVSDARRFQAGLTVDF